MGTRYAKALLAALCSWLLSFSLTQAAVIWDRFYTGPSPRGSYPFSMGIDSSGNISIGLSSFVGANPASNYAYGAASYESDGTLRWGWNLVAGEMSDAVTSREGVIFITGDSSTSAVGWNGITAWNQPLFGSVYDPTGKGMFIDCDTLGNVFVLGVYYEDYSTQAAVVICYSAFGGGELWREDLVGYAPAVSYNQHREGIKADNRGGVFIPLANLSGGYELYKFGSGAWPDPVSLISLDVEYVDIDTEGNALLVTINNNGGYSYVQKHSYVDGSLQWQQFINNSWTNSIATDQDDNVYALSNLPVQVRKISPTGDSLWSASFGLSSGGYGAMCSDKEGNLHLSIYTSPNHLVAKIDSSGIIRWTELLPPIDGYFYRQHSYIDVDDSNYVYTAIATYRQDDFPWATRILKLKGEKKVTIRDANNDSIPNVEFELIKVANDPPIFTEDTLGTFTTDSEGRLELMSFAVDSFTVALALSTDTLVVGDSLKIAKHVYTEPAVKHPVLLGTMYSVHLDNAKFDENGAMSFDTLTAGEQDIVLDHTEFRYNLVVSVQWDAGLDYLEGLELGFDLMSSYLYDVTDGQARFDTVMIFDDEEHWLEADMQIFASNMEWPRAYAAGIHVNTPGQTILFPRKWFGSQDYDRNLGYQEYPYNLAESDNYRTYAHECGHYGFGFYDEYLFVDGSGNTNQTDRCLTHQLDFYGYMDSQYEYGGGPSSEMSSVWDYTDLGCRNTAQYVQNGMSCWDFLESTHEGRYGIDNLFVPIYKPDDRPGGVTTGFDYFIGPNELQYDYDVGEKTVFPIGHTSPATFTLDVVTHDWQVNRLGNVDVVLRKPLSGNLWHEIPQGKTADVSPDGLSGGGIYVLGAENGDEIAATTDYTLIGIVNRMRGVAASGVTSNWLIGTTSVSGTGGLSLDLQPIAGDWPLVCEIGLGDSTTLLSAAAQRTFSVNPTVTVTPVGGTQQSYSLLSVASGYSLELSDTLSSSGVLTITAVDDSSFSFFFRMPYTITDLNDSTFGWLLGAEGGCEVMLDSMASGLTRGTILSSPYPVIRTGLDENAVQAGDAHSFSAHPADSLRGTHALLIRYGEGDLSVGDNLIGNESALAVYRWTDNATGWQVIGGSVDTADNVIYAPITQSGVYAAFTYDIITDVEDDEHGELLPYLFELSQNYPNPFNPVTTIEYSVPERSHVTIEVYNVLGQKVHTLVDREESAGSYTVAWDGTSTSGITVSTGIYLYRFQAGEYLETKKMLLLK